MEHCRADAGALVIVQARMGSSRLPGKVLMDICGHPMLARVISRAKAIPGIANVVVATSDRPADAPVARTATECGVAAFRGSELDVLDRYYQTATSFNAQTIIRITADCPLLDPNVAGFVLSRFLQGDVDYASNVHPRTFPQGLDTEVFSFEALSRAWHEAIDIYDREHVTPYLWRNPGHFRLANIENSRNLSNYRWTVDEARDLELVRSLASRQMTDDPSYGSIIDILRGDSGLPPDSLRTG